MKEGEKLYIKELVEALRPGGDVLEVGFRSGFAADEIQKYHPKSHTIIESGDSAEAKKWAEKHHAEVIEGTWRQVLPRLGVFDAIFFAAADPEMPQFLKTGAEVLNRVQEEIPQLSRIRYADAELEPFCAKAAADAPEQLFRFLQDLKYNGQISEEQMERMIHKYKLKGKEAPPKSGFDTVFPFLKECLSLHMRIGSRFTCFLENTVSKSEDPRFFEQIVTNPNVEFREWTIHIPKNGKGLIVLVEKLA